MTNKTVQIMKNYTFRPLSVKLITGERERERERENPSMNTVVSS